MIPKTAAVIAMLVAAALPASADPVDTQETPPDLSGFGEGANLDALNWDVSRLPAAGGKIGIAGPGGPRTDWSRTENKDGTTALTAKRSLPTEWDSKVGLDMTMSGSRGPVPAFDPLQPTQPESTGAAWATITAPALNLPAGWDKATLDARVDPSADQRRLGTTMSKSVPLNDSLSVTLQNGYAMTHQGTNPAWLDHATQGAAPTDTYSADGTAKLNVLPSRTSIGIGAARSSADDKWLRTLSTEQKLFGGVSVTGSISETPEGPANRSISAGFKKKW